MGLSTKFCIARVTPSQFRVNRRTNKFDAQVVTKDTGPGDARRNGRLSDGANWTCNQSLVLQAL
jgi:hypothetical protein